ncbi:glycosyltransferase [Novosphingobium soli]|uniref:Glycosyltransferase n=1 Tax=Novosphingobium soli TaxID=574956 RepID=A0ABV6CQ08_9SPHN
MSIEAARANDLRHGIAMPFLALARMIGPAGRRAASAPASASEAAKPATQGHVLFVSRQRIIGRTNGSSAYLLDLAAAVRRAGFTPHLIQPSPDLMGRWPVMRLRPEMKAFETHRIRGVARLGSWVVTKDPGVCTDALRGLAVRAIARLGLEWRWLADRPRPYAIASAWTADDHEFVCSRAMPEAGIVIADYAFQAEAFDSLPGRRTAIIMHDLFHSRSAGANGRDSVVQLDRSSEIALLSRAEAVIAIQADEAHFVADHVPGTRPILAPMAVAPVREPQPGESRRLLFVGSNTAPNVVGLKWLFEAVWPRLQARTSGCRLDVVGSVAAGFTGSVPAGVAFHGLVDDLSPFYTRAGVVVSPLTFGSGLKIKLVEALAHGKPVVATSVTLQGVEAQCAQAVLCADDPALFADAILSLDEPERRNELGIAALRAAREHFSPEVCHAQFVAWLSERPHDGAATCRVAP